MSSGFFTLLADTSICRHRLLILRGTKLNIDYVRLLLLAKHLPYIQMLQKKHCIMMNKTHLSLAFTFFEEMPFLMIKGALILHSS